VSAALSLPLPAPAPHLQAVPPPGGSAPVALLVLTEDGRLLPPTPEQLAPLAALLVPPAPVDEVHQLGTLQVRPAAHVATVAGRRLTLTVREFELLAALAGAHGRTVARADLLAAVWGAGTTTGPRSVDVHVARLRAKLGLAAAQLVTVRGRGYRLDPA
jgi:DNA-binding response OmpR family regulator